MQCGGFAPAGRAEGGRYLHWFCFEACFKAKNEIVQKNLETHI